MHASVISALHDWERGNPAASEDLDRLLRSYLLRLVQRRRSHGLQAKIDSEGVVNEALKSFLTGVKKHEFPNLNTSEDVKNLLATFVLRILSDQCRAQRASKRDAGREETYPGGQPVHLADTVSPTPQQVVEAHELLEKLLEVVRPVHEKAIQIMELRLEGLTNNEIAEEVALALRTVQKIISDMQAAWEQANSQEQ